MAFLEVNNNFSLININVAPTTFLYSVALLFIFLSFYISPALTLWFRRLPTSVASVLRRTGAVVAPPLNTLSGPSRRGDKPLPAPPGPYNQLVLQDQSLVVSNQDLDFVLRESACEADYRPRQLDRAMVDLLDGLDASLQDFEHPASPSPVSLRHSAVTDPDDLDDPLEDSELASAGGYSPPAWRRLGNGDRSSGFWRGPLSGLHALPSTRPSTRESSPEMRDSDVDMVLQRAVRTRLPQGSLSPEKVLGPGQQREEDDTLRIDQPNYHKDDARSLRESSPPTDNYIRFAVRAEVQQRTEPLEAAVSFISKKYTTLFSTWMSTICTLLVAIFSISAMKSLLQPAASRPAGDLVKVAGLARSFEPLIYYSEHAVAQVHDLQATSVAVWDLGESVRTSDMKDAVSIVTDLDSLSENMKTLALEMTKFFARVDGDIDAILNVMDWAKMHLNRLNNRPPPSTISSAYDNIHNILSQAHILENDAGNPTTLGTLTTYVFGMSNPQRDQRMVQLLFNEFLGILEESIKSELQHSVALFALFEAVDFHFLNLARTVVRESSAQEELHADLLSSMWSRMLGGRAAELRKFEQNRLLLRNVREKTVRNKGVLVEHNTKLLTLKASLESLRTKLVSPLVRGSNSTTLTLEDQIRGLSDVSDYLSGVRKQQRGKVMETLFASVPGKRYMIEAENGIVGEAN